MNDDIVQPAERTPEQSDAYNFGYEQGYKAARVQVADLLEKLQTLVAYPLSLTRNIGFKREVLTAIARRRAAIVSRNDYEQWLNALGAPAHQKASFGGNVPDNAQYGAWLRRHHPILFYVDYCEWKAGAFDSRSPRGSTL